jgi:hypothetical protein
MLFLGSLVSIFAKLRARSDARAPLKVQSTLSTTISSR